ncbi:MAG: hydroxymethylbilane synthase [Planctomycetota bacterium]
MGHMIRLGTRGSKLAIAQSQQVADALKELGHRVEIQLIETRGDVTSGSLAGLGGDGLFTKELQKALLDEVIDLAVHSLKDLPTDPVDGLEIAAIPSRQDPRDCFVLPGHKLLNSIDDLPKGTVVGTGSLRRKSQLLRIRPDINIKSIRGNVDTRIKKLEAGEFDAIVLACAGLNRLDLSHRISFAIPVTLVQPAVGQGALGLEIRRSDNKTREAIQPINCPQTAACVLAERTLLNQLSAGCIAPVGTTTDVNSANELSLTAIVLSEDGTKYFEIAKSGSIENYNELGKRAAQELLAKGADKIIDPFR